MKRSHACHAVLSAAVAFVAVQLGFHHTVQSDVVPLRDPIYSDKLALLKRYPEFFTDRSDAHRILAVGSSRTQLSLDAGRLGDSLTTDRQRVVAFNFGCTAAGPVTGALYLRRLFAAGVRCNRVLVEVHPAMLHDRTPPFEAAWLQPLRLRPGEADTIRGFGWDVETPPQEELFAPLTAASTYRFHLLDAAAPDLLPCPFGMNLRGRTDAFGFVPGIGVQPEDRPRFLAGTYVQYSSVFDGYRPGGPAVAAVRDMLTECRGHGVPATLLLSAESSEMRRWYGDGGNARLAEFVTALSAEFAVPVIDAREWVRDADLPDGHHPTAAGARTFTDKLADALREARR